MLLIVLAIVNDAQGKLGGYVSQPGGTFYVVLDAASGDAAQFAGKLQKLIDTEGPDLGDAWATVTSTSLGVVAVTYAGDTWRAAGGANTRLRQFLRGRGMVLQDNPPVRVMGTVVQPPPVEPAQAPPSTPPPAASAPTETLAATEGVATDAAAALPAEAATGPSEMQIALLLEDILVAISTHTGKGPVLAKVEGAPKEAIGEALSGLAHEARLVALGGKMGVHLTEIGWRYISPRINTASKVMSALLGGSKAGAKDLVESTGESISGVKRALESLVAEGMVEQRGHAPRPAGRRGNPPKGYNLTDRGVRIGEAYRSPYVVGGVGWGEQQTPRRTAVLSALLNLPDDTAATAGHIAAEAEVSVTIATAILLEGFTLGLIERQLIGKGDQQYCYQFTPVGRRQAQIAIGVPVTEPVPQQPTRSVFLVTVSDLDVVAERLLATLRQRPGVTLVEQEQDGSGE